MNPRLTECYHHIHFCMVVKSVYIYEMCRDLKPYPRPSRHYVGYAPVSFLTQLKCLNQLRPDLSFLGYP